MKIGFLVVDAVASLYAFQAAAAALYARQTGQGGRHLDISLMQATAAVQAPKIAEAAIEGETDSALNVPAGNYRTADGWLSISLMREKSFAGICNAIGQAELADDPRFNSFAVRRDNAAELIRVLDDAFLTAPTNRWVAALQKEEVMCSQVNSVTDWLEDPHVRESGSAPAMQQKGVGKVALPLLPGLDPGSAAGGLTAPDVGEHNAAILGDHGFSRSEFAELEKAGIFRRATT